MITKNLNEINTDIYNNAIAYDLDGTLFSIKKAVEVFNRQTGESKKIRDMTSYSFAEVFNITRDEEINIWNTYSEEIILESTVNKTLVEDLKQKKDAGNKIIVVTARDKRFRNANITALTENDIPVDLLIDGQKAKYTALKKLQAKTFYDDQGALIEKLSKTDLPKFCELVLIDAPYNQNFEHKNRFMLY